MSSPNDLLSSAIFTLFERERLFAETLLGMDRKFTTSIPTLGVCIKERVQLHINPDYFTMLTPELRVSALIHEIKHIIYDHIPRMKEMAPEVYTKPSKDFADDILKTLKHRVLNIGADCSINCNIENLHEDWIHPKRFDLEDGQTAEWYVEHLKDNEKMKQMMPDGFDDHSLWSESEGDANILREKIRQHVNEAATRVKNAAGHLTGSEQLVLDNLNNRAKDWKADLRRFAARTSKTLLESTRKKRNRRYGIRSPGYIRHERLTLGVIFDVSGSVPEEALEQFYTEVQNISKYADVWVVQADAEVKSAAKFKASSTYSINGRGGTAYQPALDYFSNEIDVDGVIYFGDMDCYDEEDIKKPSYPVIWAVYGNQDPPVSWGYRTKVEIKK